MPVEFNFEILDAETINIRYNYGGEWFEFNLFRDERGWMLHPFDAVLLGNPEMCRLVVTDLLAHKPCQVMLAKERIRLSGIRTTIDVSGDRETFADSDRFEAGSRRDFGQDRPGPGRDDGDSFDGGTEIIRGRGARDRGSPNPAGDKEGAGPAEEDLDAWIANNSLQDILRQEKEALERRMTRYNVLLQKMFYDNLGPGNDEFDTVQSVFRLYKEAVAKLSGLMENKGA